MKPWVIFRALAIMALITAAIWLLFFSNFPDAYSESAARDSGGFQEVFWEERPLDLAVQACLIIAGALGVAALLPAEYEE